MTRRIDTLDVLRGFVVILAFIQHYTGYLGEWYITYFREAPIIDTHYQVHAAGMGRNLPTDAAVLLLGRLFVPWVSLSYIALAAFNLARRSQADFRAAYGGKLRVFLTLMIFFQIENAVVSLNFGHALSIYPLAIWMALLALLATVYRFAGVSGVGVLFALSWLRFLVPIDDWNLAGQIWIQNHVHPGFRYNATFDLFLIPACAGFLLGWWHYQSGIWRQRLTIPIFGLGALFCLLYLVSGTATHVEATNIFANEHDAKQLIPMLGVVGLLLLLIPGLLQLEERGFVWRVPVLHWLGVHSLLVFAAHRVLFVFLWVPAREWLGAQWGIPLRNTIDEVLLYIALTILTVWGMRTLGLFRMMSR